MRIAAVERVLGVALDPQASMREVKKFVSERLYGTPQWGRYLYELNQLKKNRNDIQSTAARSI